MYRSATIPYLHTASKSPKFHKGSFPPTSNGSVNLQIAPFNPKPLRHFQIRLERFPFLASNGGVADLVETVFGDEGEEGSGDWGGHLRERVERAKEQACEGNTKRHQTSNNRKPSKRKPKNRSETLAVIHTFLPRRWLNPHKEPHTPFPTPPPTSPHTPKSPQSSPPNSTYPQASVKLCC